MDQNEQYKILIEKVNYIFYWSIKKDSRYLVLVPGAPKTLRSLNKLGWAYKQFDD